jgi:hypothetical protein
MHRNMFFAVDNHCARTREEHEKSKIALAAFVE